MNERSPSQPNEGCQGVLACFFCPIVLLYSRRGRTHFLSLYTQAYSIHDGECNDSQCSPLGFLISTLALPSSAVGPDIFVAAVIYSVVAGYLAEG